jgi:hypothetical protein
VTLFQVLALSHPSLCCSFSKQLLTGNPYSSSATLYSRNPYCDRVFAKGWLARRFLRISRLLRIHFSTRPMTADSRANHSFSTFLGESTRLLNDLSNFGLFMGDHVSLTARLDLVLPRVQPSKKRTRRAPLGHLPLDFNGEDSYLSRQTRRLEQGHLFHIYWFAVHDGWLADSKHEYGCMTISAPRVLVSG